MNRQPLRGRWPFGLLGLLALTLTGCAPGTGGTAAASRPAAPAAAAVVEVQMVDHRFEFATPVPAGRVVFRLTNAGRSPHNLVLIPLPEDLPPIQEQIRGTKRRLVEPYAGIYDRPPGDTGTFAVNLLPGQRYAMICTVVDADGEPHSKKGMATEFRTPEAAPT
ncbi:MAG: hypothetical protein WD794_05420 [Mycobacteriales bacterium]